MDGFKEPLLLQYVGGHYELIEFKDKTIEPNAIVFIGQGFNRDKLEIILYSIIVRL